jgi:hypothetical protein
MIERSSRSRPRETGDEAFLKLGETASQYADPFMVSCRWDVFSFTIRRFNAIVGGALSRQRNEAVSEKGAPITAA